MTKTNDLEDKIQEITLKYSEGTHNADLIVNHLKELKTLQTSQIREHYLKSNSRKIIQFAPIWRELAKFALALTDSKIITVSPEANYLLSLLQDLGHILKFWSSYLGKAYQVFDEIHEQCKILRSNRRQTGKNKFDGEHFPSLIDKGMNASSQLTFAIERATETSPRMQNSTSKTQPKGIYPWKIVPKSPVNIFGIKPKPQTPEAQKTPKPPDGQTWSFAEESILKILKNGRYPLDMLHDELGKAGSNISMSSLKDYLRRTSPLRKFVGNKRSIGYYLYGVDYNKNSE